MSTRVIALSWFAVTIAMSTVAADEVPRPTRRYVASGVLASKHATQAAAADERHVFAISSVAIAKLDRATGRELAVSRGPAQHLNSGFFWNGKLYCAHSNYPRMPHESDVRVLDTNSMTLTIAHTFDHPPGSLTWVVRRGPHWWCHFAHYGADNGKSVLVKLNDSWQELERWTFPPNLIADWDAFSLSGGIWHGDDLLAIGHDKTTLYRLRIPKKGRVIDLVETLEAPFPGQGIALDPRTGGLVGIDRGKRQIVFATLESK